MSKRISKEKQPLAEEKTRTFQGNSDVPESICNYLTKEEKRVLPSLQREYPSEPAGRAEARRKSKAGKK
jgi:hypothetical protein